MIEEISFWDKAWHENGMEYRVALKDQLYRAALNEGAYVRLEGNNARVGTIGKVDFKDAAWKAVDILSEKEFLALQAAGETDLPISPRLKQILFGWEKSYYVGVGPTRDVAVEWIDAGTYDDYIQWASSSYFHLRMDNSKIIKPKKFNINSWESDPLVDHGFVWLKGYTGPTVSKFNEVPKEERQKNKFVFRDCYEEELKLGDFVAVQYGIGVGGAVITKISASGRSVTVKLDNGNEQLIANSYKIMKIDDKLKSRVMMQRLSA